MRILNISKYSFNFRGGVEKEAKKVSEQLSEIYQVDTICFGENSCERKLSANEKIISFKSLKLFNKIDLSISQIFFLLKNINKYDLVWLHYPNIFPVLPLLLTKKADIIIQYHNDIKVLPLLYKIFKPFENLILKKSKIIITSSPNYHKSSNALSRFEEKIKCIPIKIEKLPNLFHPIKPVGFDQIILTTIGRYTEYKGYENIINLVSNNQKFKLNIISSSAFPSEVNNLVNNSKNVQILKGLDDNEMNNVLKESHVFILSSISRSEGFGIVLLEALRLGLPICVNRLEDTGSEFITRPGFNGEFFNIRDNYSLFKALEKICNPSSYHNYSSGALEDFDSRFCLNEDKYFLSILKK
jgi:glycosyltransferase involved in cell wall biosynthesis